MAALTISGWKSAGHWQCAMKGKYQAVALALLAALTLAACSATGGNQMHAGAPMHPAASAAPRWTLVALGTCPSRWASQSSGRGKSITRRSGMIHCRSELRYPTRVGSGQPEDS